MSLRAIKPDIILARVKSAFGPDGPYETKTAVGFDFGGAGMFPVANGALERFSHPAPPPGSEHRFPFFFGRLRARHCTRPSGICDMAPDVIRDKKPARDKIRRWGTALAHQESRFMPGSLNIGERSVLRERAAKFARQSRVFLKKKIFGGRPDP